LYAPAKEHTNHAKSALDSVFEALASLEPAKKKTGEGRPPTFSPAEVDSIYAARARGVTWAQINEALADRGLARAGTLASSVHASAKRHGMVVQTQPRKPRGE
jgi:hypothetical protein